MFKNKVEIVKENINKVANKLDEIDGIKLKSLQQSFHHSPFYLCICGYKEDTIIHNGRIAHYCFKCHRRMIHFCKHGKHNIMDCGICYLEYYQWYFRKTQWLMRIGMKNENYAMKSLIKRLKKNGLIKV